MFQPPSPTKSLLKKLTESTPQFSSLRDLQLENLATQCNGNLTHIIFDFTRYKEPNLSDKTFLAITKWLKTDLKLEEKSVEEVLSAIFRTIEEGGSSCLMDLKRSDKNLKPIRIAFLAPESRKKFDFSEGKLGISYLAKGIIYKPSVTPQQNLDWANFHELAHLIHKKHHTEYKGESEGQIMQEKHRDEMFADVFATLLSLKMHPENGTGAIRHWLVKRKLLPFFVFDRGPKYYTATGIEEALRVSKNVNLRQMTFDQLQRLSQQITDKTAYSVKELEKIGKITTDVRLKLDSRKIPGNQFVSLAVRERLLDPREKFVKDLIQSSRQVFGDKR